MPSYVMTINRPGLLPESEPEIIETGDFPPTPEILDAIFARVEQLTPEKDFSMPDEWDKLLATINRDRENAADFAPEDGFRYQLPDGYVVEVSPLKVTREDGSPDRAASLLYLSGDTPQAGTPGSRFGRNAEDCAPTAYALALCYADASGDFTTDTLDHCMSLVVNDHDDVLTMLRDHGHGLTGEDAEHVRELLKGYPNTPDDGEREASS